MMSHFSGKQTHLSMHYYMRRKQYNVFSFETQMHRYTYGLKFQWKESQKKPLENSKHVSSYFCETQEDILFLYYGFCNNLNIHNGQTFSQLKDIIKWVLLSHFISHQEIIKETGSLSKWIMLQKDVLLFWVRIQWRTKGMLAMAVFKDVFPLWISICVHVCACDGVCLTRLEASDAVELELHVAMNCLCGC